MLSQTKSKKGVSVMIGYILLVSFSVIIGAVIYQNLKTYTPTDSIDCPDSVSIFLKEYSCVGSQLTLTLKNNGKFNIAGYFIHATTDSDQEVATSDLSSYFIENSGDGGAILKNSIIFDVVSENTMTINEEKVSVFVFGDTPSISSIEIIPVRFQEEKNKMVFVTCGRAKISEEIIC